MPIQIQTKKGQKNITVKTGRYKIPIMASLLTMGLLTLAQEPIGWWIAAWIAGSVLVLTLLDRVEKRYRDSAEGDT